jgi:hypothetical protein
VLSPKQKNKIGVVTALPFLLMLFLFILSPGYESQLFNPAPTYAICAGAMVMMLLIFQGLVAVSLRIAFLQSNKQERKVSEYKSSSLLSKIVIYTIFLLCLCFTLISMWIVLMGPAMIQLMSTDG